MRKYAYYIAGYTNGDATTDRQGTHFEKDVKVYDLNELLEHPALNGLEEHYQDIKEDDEPDFNDLTDEEKEKWILRYSNFDPIFDVYGYETEAKAKDVLEKLQSVYEYAIDMMSF